MSGSTEFWMESRAQEGAAQRSASCLAERPSIEVTAASRRNGRRWFGGTGSMLAVRHNWTKVEFAAGMSNRSENQVAEGEDP